MLTLRPSSPMARWLVCAGKVTSDSTPPSDGATKGRCRCCKAVKSNTMMAGPVRLFAMHGSETPGKGSSVSMAGAGLSIGTMDATKSERMT